MSVVKLRLAARSKGQPVCFGGCARVRVTEDWMQWLTAVQVQPTAAIGWRQQGQRSDHQERQRHQSRPHRVEHLLS